MRHSTYLRAVGVDDLPPWDCRVTVGPGLAKPFPRACMVVASLTDAKDGRLKVSRTNWRTRADAHRIVDALNGPPEWSERVNPAHLRAYAVVRIKELK